jgi:hypothetical protein
MSTGPRTCFYSDTTHYLNCTTLGLRRFWDPGLLITGVGATAEQTPPSCIPNPLGLPGMKDSDGELYWVERALQPTAPLFPSLSCLFCRSGWSQEGASLRAAAPVRPRTHSTGKRPVEWGVSWLCPQPPTHDLSPQLGLDSCSWPSPLLAFGDFPAPR